MMKLSLEDGIVRIWCLKLNPIPQTHGFLLFKAMYGGTPRAGEEETGELLELAFWLA